MFKNSLPRGVNKIIQNLAVKGVNLRERQRDILPSLLKNDYYMLLWAMRSGKSIPTAIACMYRSVKTLIICPKSAIRGWEETISMLDAEDKFEILSIGMLQKTSYENGSLDAYIDNGFGAVVYDEGHQYRARSSRFVLAKAIAQHIPIRFMLTGSLYDKDRLESFYPIHILDDGKHFGNNRQKFLSKWGYKLNPFSKFDDWIMQPHKEKKFDKILAKFSDKNAPTEIMEPVEVEHTFTLTSKQEELIDSLTNRRRIPFFNGSDSDFSVAIINNKCHQVASSFMLQTDEEIIEGVDGDKVIKEQRVYRNIPTRKWELLKELCDKLEGQILLFVAYQEEYHLIEKALGKGNVVKYNPKSFSKWRNNKVRIMMAHCRSASTGLDASNASHCIFVSESTSGVDFAQARRRLSTYGGTDVKTIHYLVAKSEQGYDRRSMMDGKVKNIEGFLK